jgi:hypothetical protein
MIAMPRFASMFQPTRRRIWLCLLLLPVLLAGCGGGGDGEEEVLLTGSASTAELTPSVEVAEIPGPLVDLWLGEEDVTLEPLPLRAGFPFTVTAVVHNNAEIPAVDVPVVIYISAAQEQIGYSPFLQQITVTVPASDSVPIEMPVHWNFGGGEHRIWIQVNRVPEAWGDRTPPLAEADTGDNLVLLDAVVDPFDAYTLDLCSGRVDVEIGPADILPEPDQQRVLVLIHNQGNRAVYNLPVVVSGDELTGISYTPVIPPCGGTAEVVVDVDRPFNTGESLTVQINPSDWSGALEESDFQNNRVSVSAGLAPGLVMPPGGGLEDYDFALTTEDIETPELWIVLVTVHNLGTRDADRVPIRVENRSGRKLVDAIPLVQGEGSGVAAIRVGYLWLPGGTLTFTVNSQDAKGAYPESNRDNNVATFTLP